MRRFFRITKARSISNHLSFIASGEKRKSWGTCGALVGEETITIDASVTGKRFLQFFPTHALDRITPQAVHSSDNAHKPELSHQCIACSHASVGRCACA